MGQNFTIYANLQGGGIRLLDTQKTSPNEYRASFYVEPWSSGISSVQLIEGGRPLAPHLTSGESPYQSPVPTSVTGFYSVAYSATAQDTTVAFTNIWGAVTTIDLGTPAAPAPLSTLVPATTAVAFGVAFLIWFVVSGILRTKKADIRE